MTIVMPQAGFFEVVYHGKSPGLVSSSSGPTTFLKARNGFNIR